MENMIKVTAAVLPGKLDPSAEAYFVNGSRASAYALLLSDSGDYCAVWITDHRGQVHLITGSEA